MNSQSLSHTQDLGGDGDIDGNSNGNFARDAAGFSLGYYNGVYKPIAETERTTPFKAANIYSKFNNASVGANLFNGNISHMVTAIYLDGNPADQNHEADTKSPKLSAYRYDQLNRIKVASSSSVMSNNNFVFDASSQNEYLEAFNFDPMGNITNLQRNKNATAIDVLNYTYKRDGNYIEENRLYNVSDNAYTSTPNGRKDYNYNNDAVFDMADESTHEYGYDAIGNLVKDKSESIQQIKWTVYGKVKEVIRESGCIKPDLEFRYDPMGNRITKIVKGKVQSGAQKGDLLKEYEWTTTLYVRDASGNVMAVYEESTEVVDISNLSATAAGTFKRNSKLIEQDIYGSSRLGMKKSNLAVGSYPFSAKLNADGVRLDIVGAYGASTIPLAAIAN